MVLFSTKYGPGLYKPRPDWPQHMLKPARVILRQPLYLAARPRTYLKLLGLAMRTGTMVDFLVGMDFAQAMKACGVTSIHCKEGLHSLNIGFYCRQILGLPLTVTIYADALYIPPSPALFRMALDSCTAIVTVCEFNRDLLVARFGVPAEKVKVIPLHFSSEQFRPRRQVSVLIVAQFAERKGHEILFRAVRTLERDDIVVWVVGGKASGLGEDYVDVPRSVPVLNHIELVALITVGLDRHTVKGNTDTAAVVLIPDERRSGGPVGKRTARAGMDSQ